MDKKPGNKNVKVKPSTSSEKSNKNNAKLSKKHSTTPKVEVNPSEVSIKNMESPIVKPIPVVTPKSNVKLNENPTENFKTPTENFKTPIPIGTPTTKPEIKLSTGNATPKSRKRLASESQSRVQNLFDHLPKSSDRKSLFETTTTSGSGLRNQVLPPHPIFYTLGIKFALGRIRGSNSRCMALLHGIKEYIESYVTPEGKDFRYAFAQSLKTNLNFLRRCRPFAVAMDNAVEFINSKFHRFAGEFNTSGTNDDNILQQEKRTESEVREDIIQALTDFQDAIEKAKEAIVENSEDKIKTGDTILIYGYSEVVWKALLAAAEHKTFSLVVIESRAMDNEKKGMGLDIIAQFLDKKLEKSLISVTYTSITGLSNVLQTVTKVFLGAHALLTNGGVLAHTGSSQIALIATAHNIPVLVCCETYKFCDKSPTDSFFHNELAVSFGPFQNETKQKCYGGGGGLGEEFLQDGMTGLSLDDSLITNGFLITPVIKYDVTPPELVTAVITDVDILPCTSVPVVLRVQENRKH